MKGIFVSQDMLSNSFLSFDNRLSYAIRIIYNYSNLLF
jgi:hypothetical protein